MGQCVGEGLPLALTSLDGRGHLQTQVGFLKEVLPERVR